MLQGATVAGRIFTRARSGRLIHTLCFIGFLACFYAFYGYSAILIISFFVATLLFTVARLTGISLGFHRLFTHTSFEATRSAKIMLGILGSIAAQGPLLDWVIDHLRHHRWSDRKRDPHSPVYGATDGLFSKMKTFWHGHIKWIYTGTEPYDYSRLDLANDKTACFIHRSFLVWVIGSLVLGGALGGIITECIEGYFWYGTFLGFLSMGLASLFWTFHWTFSVNSFAHMWGRKRFETHDNSRNNDIVAAGTLGEGYQRNHHAFPWSARLGFTKRERVFDTGFQIIKFLEWCGLVLEDSVSEPTLEQIAEREIVTERIKIPTTS